MTQTRRQQAIAQRVGIGSSTVSNWLAAGTFPERKPREQACRLDPYLPYVFERWEAGCHNIASLFRERGDRGSKGSYASVYGPLVRLLPQGRKHAPGANVISPAPLPAREATFLFLRRPEELSAQEQETVLLLRQSHPEVNLMADLVQQFVHMLRTRSREQLEGWLTNGAVSQIPELQRCVLGIERDKAAVLAGLTLPHSNGVVEGKVNKLKLIKRMGYGRAGFPLLRQRVLHAL